MTRVIGIMAGKGGVGKTTVAINLACALGLLNHKTTLVDFNFTTSHLAMDFGIIPEVTLNNVLRNEASIDTAIYPCFNIFVVPASLSLNDLKNVEISNMKPRIKEFLEGFDVALLDAAPGFGREAMASIQSSDDVIFVVNPTVASIADVIKCKQLILQLGVNPLGIVINRYRKKSFELGPEEISKLIELPVLAVIREDEDFLKSEAAKIPMVFYKRNKAEEFLKLASMLTGKEYKKPGFFQRLFFGSSQPETRVEISGL